MLKDTIKPKTIIIDKTPLLNAEIDDIRNDLNRQLEILSKKLKPVKLPSRKGVEGKTNQEALEQKVRGVNVDRAGVVLPKIPYSHMTC